MSWPELYGIITPAGNMFGHSSSRGKAEQHAEQTGNTVVRYIPAPTWSPIAEMPEEWRDGRMILTLDTRLSFHIKPMRTHGGLPEIWFHHYTCKRANTPTHYLDLTIPEVPRG